jgi:hypothetical protein
MDGSRGSAVVFLPLLLAKVRFCVAFGASLCEKTMKFNILRCNALDKLSTVILGARTKAAGHQERQFVSFVTLRKVRGRILRFCLRKIERILE